MTADCLFLNSITDAGAAARGRIAVCGSHGGMFAATVAARAGLRAVILNDAGHGLNAAGIRGVQALADIGMAAAAVDCMSAEIGAARDSLEHGILSSVNAVAAGLGLAPGQTVHRALTVLTSAPEPNGTMPDIAEARWQEAVGPHRVLCVDSASLIGPGDAGRIIVTGSHGGLIGGDPTRACKAAARLVAFSDAGGGKNGIGFTRLPALEARGIGAVTLDAQSCEIGSAASALASGRISAVNAIAAALGIAPGADLRAAILTLDAG